MKVVYLHQYFKTPDMAGGTRSYEMARRLVASGHEVHVIASAADATWRFGWRVQHIAGITVHWLPVDYDNRMSHPRRILAFLLFASRSMVKARRLRGDVVLATSTPLSIALPGIAASLGRCPMVFEVRDLWPEVPIAMGVLKGRPAKYLARRLEHLAYVRSSAVVALSDGMAAGVRAAGYQGRVVVIPNSCDNELFRVPDEQGREFRSARAWLKDRPLVIYTGTFGRVNGVGYMVDLALRTATFAPDVRFLAVGSGAELDDVLVKAERAGVLNKNFFVEPPVSKTDLPRLLNAADVCTSWVLPVPQLAKNSANKFFDALAAGRPIAINHEGWMKELIEREEIGVALDPRDLEASAHQLYRFLSDPSRVARARVRASELAQESFSRDRLADQLREVLNTSVESFTGRP